MLFAIALLPLVLTSCQKTQDVDSQDTSEAQVSSDEIESKYVDFQVLAEQGDA